MASGGRQPLTLSAAIGERCVHPLMARAASRLDFGFGGWWLSLSEVIVTRSVSEETAALPR